MEIELRIEIKEYIYDLNQKKKYAILSPLEYRALKIMTQVLDDESKQDSRL